jgi:SagB-type dehydrogenase family enzyme
VSELYHENSKLHRSTPAVAGDYALDDLGVVTRSWKSYRLSPRVELPPPEAQPAVTEAFDDVVAARRTVRDFADADLEVGELAKVLHQTYGCTGTLPYSGGGRHLLRAAPSAGSLYPAELYVAVRRVRGVPAGLYHYELGEHALALLRPGDPTERLYEVCCRQELAREAAATVLVAASFPRTKHRYGERGYRYVLLDVGHLMQNLLLASGALGIGAMTTCGFYDDAAGELLRLDGVDEAVLYVAFLGRPGAGGAARTEVL